MKSFFDMLPARAKARSREIVADLDAIVCEPIYFKVLGKTHALKPIDTGTFLAMIGGFGAMLDVKVKADSNEKITDDELVRAYGKLFSAVCDTLGEKEVRRLTHAQLWGILALITEHVTGRAHAEKKKIRLPPPTILPKP
jgi:hypothetical protein